MENELCKKKTTAPDTSVGADDGQPLHNSTENSISAFEGEINGDFQNSTESLDEIYRRMQRLTDPHYLHTISMTELYQTAYQSRPPIIDGLLYAGAYILAGAPKIGKSFLVAQIAYHVSTGEALWGCEVHPGTVLYLALEDDFQRIQSRMFMMYGVNDTDRLHFATAAGKIGNGLDEQLENFVREHPDTRLIIIDTMQKIREVGGEAYSYASDYEIIGRLKQFADKHCICVLTVHHTRKQPASDSFEMISGTTGLLGCADGSLLMQKKKRTALEATIIDLSAIPFEVLSIVISLLSRIIFDFAFHYSKLRHHEGKVNDIPFMLVCEEAHNYIPKSGGAEYAASKHSIERIAKEGRKYGLSLMVVSQRPSEVSDTIFSQCNNFVVLKLTNINDQNCIKNLLPDNNSSLVDVLPTLSAGECLIVGDAAPLPAVIKMDMPNPIPNSSNVNVYDEWNKNWIDIAFETVIKRWWKE